MSILTGKGQDTWCGMLTDLQFVPWIWFRLDFLRHWEKNFDRWVDSSGDLHLCQPHLETRVVILILLAETITLQYPSYSKCHWSPLLWSTTNPVACDPNLPGISGTPGLSENTHTHLSHPGRYIPLSAFFGDNFRCWVINSIPRIADSTVGRFPSQIRILFYVFVFFSHKRGKFC